MNTTILLKQAITMIGEQDLVHWGTAHDRVTLAALRAALQPPIGEASGDTESRTEASATLIELVRLLVEALRSVHGGDVALGKLAANRPRLLAELQALAR